MTITIPVWLLWTLGLGIGIPAFIVLCCLAWMGWQLMKAFHL